MTVRQSLVQSAAFSLGALACLFAATIPSASAQVIDMSGYLSGYVYVDRNNDGVLTFDDPMTTNDHPERVIVGATLTLRRLDVNSFVPRTTTTNMTGLFEFGALHSGTYSITETQPTGYIDGLETLGRLYDNSNAFVEITTAERGTVFNDFITGIVLDVGDKGYLYNFGERGLMSSALSKRNLLSTATAPAFVPIILSNPTPTAIANSPEPAAAVLAAVACAAAALHARRRRSAA